MIVTIFYLFELTSEMWCTLENKHANYAGSYSVCATFLMLFFHRQKQIGYSLDKITLSFIINFI